MISWTPLPPRHGRKRPDPQFSTLLHRFLSGLSPDRFHAQCGLTCLDSSARRRAGRHRGKLAPGTVVSRHHCDVQAAPAAAPAHRSALDDGGSRPKRHGILVNRDTARLQAMVGTLWYTGILDHLCRQIAQYGTAYVLEIGAGYGALCYHLRRIPASTHLPDC